jgi:putative PIG3 family NAD(P)H quinone oxidoreductase
MDLVEASGAGGPEVLQMARGAVPQPARQEVLIRVRAAGVNRPDVLQRLGRYPVPPDASPIIGLEVAGEVAALGPECQGLALGDKVCALTNGGGYAQYCRAPQGQVLPWPKGYDAVRAAALPETFFTVWANVFQMGRLRAGEIALIHGGTSGIGTAAIQLCVARGHKVFSTAASPQKCAAIEKLGGFPINYKESNFVEIVKGQTAGRGVDVILDMVGGDYIQRNMSAAALWGRIANIAYMSGMQANVNFGVMLMKRLSLLATTLRTRTNDEKGAIRDAVQREVWPLIDAGKIKPIIDSKFPLAEAQAAHQRMKGSAHIGKILLTL